MFELNSTFMAPLSFQLPTSVFIIDVHIRITFLAPDQFAPIIPFPLLTAFAFLSHLSTQICGRIGSSRVISRTQQHHELKISSRLVQSGGSRSAQVDFFMVVAFSGWESCFYRLYGMGDSSFLCSNPLSNLIDRGDCTDDGMWTTIFVQVEQDGRMVVGIRPGGIGEGGGARGWSTFAYSCT